MHLFRLQVSYADTVRAVGWGNEFFISGYIYCNHKESGEVQVYSSDEPNTDITSDTFLSNYDVVNDTLYLDESSFLFALRGSELIPSKVNGVPLNEIKDFILLGNESYAAIIPKDKMEYVAKNFGYLGMNEDIKAYLAANGDISSNQDNSHTTECDEAECQYNIDIFYRLNHDYGKFSNKTVLFNNRSYEAGGSVIHLKKDGTLTYCYLLDNSFWVYEKDLIEIKKGLAND